MASAEMVLNAGDLASFVSWNSAISLVQRNAPAVVAAAWQFMACAVPAQCTTRCARQRVEPRTRLGHALQRHGPVVLPLAADGVDQQVHLQTLL